MVSGPRAHLVSKAGRGIPAGPEQVLRAFKENLELMK